MGTTPEHSAPDERGGRPPRGYSLAVLPPRLAALRFVDPGPGTDDALAARTAATVPGARVLLLGASRPGLVRALRAADLDVVVVDSSRTALRRAQGELGDGTALLLAADPRELEIPGGVNAALVTSAVWRAVLLDVDRRHVLRSIEGELRPGGRLLLDLERLPPAPDDWEPLAADEETEWRREPAHDAIQVRAADDEVLFAAFAPEAAVQEACDEGFERETLTDARTGADADAGTGSVWACLRSTRGRG